VRRVRRRVLGAKFVSGTADTGRLILSREDGSTAVCAVILLRGTLFDNADSTFSFTG